MNARPNTQGSRNMDAETAQWLDQLDDIGEERGYFQPMGPNHSAIFTDESPTLLVTFETIENIRSGSEDGLPLGFEMVQENGWSHLCILGHSDNWFRDPFVYAYFDRLVDDGFFEDFDQVVFYGAGMCGYAAAAFSVASPGATVVAIQPQATLDPRVTEWDRRFTSMRRTSFSDRYGYAPDMVDAAEKVFVLYDPEERIDAMHASLFTMHHVSKLRCRFLGDHIESDLQNMDILGDLIELACKGTLTEQEFSTLYRARRDYVPYLKNLLRALDRQSRPIITRAMLESLVKRMPARAFKKRLASLQKAEEVTDA